MITVYFDDQCGLCSKEIAVYRRADKSNSFEWLGLSDQTLDLESEGLELVAALTIGSSLIIRLLQHGG